MKTLPIPAGWCFLALGGFPPSSQRVERVLLSAESDRQVEPGCVFGPRNPFSQRLVLSSEESTISWHIYEEAARDGKEDACNSSLFSVDIKYRGEGGFCLPNAWCSSLALPACNDFFFNVMRGVILTSFLKHSFIQENKPVGTSILQLVVTDRDSFHNGPPFSFSILSGNEDEEFMLDSHGILRSAVVFRHMESPEYLLCIQVQLCSLSTLGAAFLHVCPSAC